MKKQYLNPKGLYVSGQVSWDREGAVVGMNGYMVGMNADRVAAYREVRMRHLKSGQLPASTLVGVERLVHEDLLLEVEVIAALQG